jgi:hypothetical protein
MDQLFSIAISVGFVLTVVLVLSKAFRLSSKYERTPKELNTWSAQDQGLDLSQDGENERP